MPTAKRRSLKVFLCHAHGDKTPVRELYLRLTRDGVDAWLDKEKLLPGQDWEYEIRKAVREADVVVVCLSRQFNQAGFRQKEVRLALDTAMEQPEGEIFIVPARLEECDTLESLRKWHWVDLFEENGYEMLLRALRARADRSGATLQGKRGGLPDVAAPLKNVKTVPEKGRVFPEIEEKSSEPVTPRTTASRKLNTTIIVALIGFAGTVIAGLLSSPLMEKLLFPAPASTEVVTATIPLTSPPAGAAQTHTQTLVSPGVSTSSGPLPVELTDDKGVTMVFIPQSEFVMGSDLGDNGEKPAHTVFLKDYYIDKFEVTNILYKTCVETGGCSPPYDSSSATRDDYFGNPDFDQHPVLFVDWEGAKRYCEWRGARLPTEAEWEKAARGKTDERIYPWGGDAKINFANYDQGMDDTTRVGSYEDGKSPYGVYDMAGNVWEWVNDWYSETYYSVQPAGIENPIGPQTGTEKVLRGGSWMSDSIDIRTYRRFAFSPSDVNNDFGFRCARDASP
jgi:formylglycine-generating enzyme required for sulfatase activity